MQLGVKRVGHGKGPPIGDSAGGGQVLDVHIDDVGRSERMWRRMNESGEAALGFVMFDMHP